MSAILHRQLGREYPVALKGLGSLLRDAHGREYIDACGGAAVSAIGHGHPAVIEAMHAQLGCLEYAHTSFFTSEPAEELAAELISHAPAGLSRVYFTCGGSEAVEAALKIGRQYFVERGEPGRRHFIARRQSYHGNTLGALAVGGNEWRRGQFEPLLINTHYVSPCYGYRGLLSNETDEGYSDRLVKEFENKIAEIGPQSVIGFVAETVGGATAGAIVPPPNYFKRIREICDRYGILLILDEIMCGMGRTGTLHACEQEGVSPDLLTVAKGLGGGYAPIGAVLITRRISEAIAKGSGQLQHGHTFAGHPVSCSAALAVQRVIRDEGLLSNVVKQGCRLQEELTARFAQHPHVGDIRGRGLLLAVEIVANRTTKEPFDPRVKFHAKLKQNALEHAVLVYTMGGTIDGLAGDHVLLAPAYNADSATISEIVKRLALSIDDTVAGVASKADQ